MINLLKKLGIVKYLESNMSYLTIQLRRFTRLDLSGFDPWNLQFMKINGLFHNSVGTAYQIPKGYSIHYYYLESNCTSMKTITLVDSDCSILHTVEFVIILCT